MPIRIAGEGGEGDFHILLDRQSALNIGAFVVDGIDLSPGTAIPSDGDPRIDHALKGFLFTCGPEHIRHPEEIEDGAGTYPLHGSLAGTRVLEARMAGMEGCTGVIELDLAGGGRARLERRWSVDAGAVHLYDRLTNIGDKAFAPMMMYHINLGGWLMAPETVMSADAFAGEPRPWRFGEGESAHFCLPAHGRDGWSDVVLGPFPALSGRSLQVRFATATLPYLQMWRCERGGANVISIEPVSHRIAKRPELAAAGEMLPLQPTASTSYELTFRVA
ncbi:MULTISPECIES: DUF4432 family protein [unclassified Rhizobium]|uniref:DUF4432 family protein n=1 Tax=unclassified Rhizobium TaxID=2613769 RepID=UPI0006FED808|nr:MULTISPECIES: DUF4432 family protein [unclassified Rhizobium]KQV38446.1 hypothetical protein ASC86_09560 [Rhizobium sp. Root1212]KRD31099.1 hypothetical protein ASE37_09550 [Rhizobium sp. Root268]